MMSVLSGHGKIGENIGMFGCAVWCLALLSCAVIFLSLRRERQSVVSQAHPSHTAEGSTHTLDHLPFPRTTLPGPAVRLAS